jgi:hypothetical protein
MSDVNNLIYVRYIVDFSGIETQDCSGNACSRRFSNLSSTSNVLICRFSLSSETCLHRATAESPLWFRYHKLTSVRFHNLPDGLERRCELLVVLSLRWKLWYYLRAPQSLEVSWWFSFRRQFLQSWKFPRLDKVSLPSVLPLSSVPFPFEFLWRVCFPVQSPLQWLQISWGRSLRLLFLPWRRKDSKRRLNCFPHSEHPMR